MCWRLVFSWNRTVDYCNTVLAGTPRTVTDTGQVTACVERCCACRYRHLEFWPRPGSDTAWRTLLARRPRLGVFQAGSDSSPVSERPRTPYRSVGLLRSGRQCRHSAAPAFRQPSTTCSTSLPAQHFSVAGPTVWNSLPNFIRDPTISAVCFSRLLKTHLFARY